MQIVLLAICHIKCIHFPLRKICIYGSDFHKRINHVPYQYFVSFLFLTFYEIKKQVHIVHICFYKATTHPSTFGYYHHRTNNDYPFNISKLNMLLLWGWCVIFNGSGGGYDNDADCLWILWWLELYLFIKRWWRVRWWWLESGEGGMFGANDRVSVHRGGNVRLNFFQNQIWRNTLRNTWFLNFKK